jgi:hypothetical protein
VAVGKTPLKVIQAQNIACKLVVLGSRNVRKFAEITVLVPFVKHPHAITLTVPAEDLSSSKKNQSVAWKPLCLSTDVTDFIAFGSIQKTGLKPS